MFKSVKTQRTTGAYPGATASRRRTMTLACAATLLSAAGWGCSADYSDLDPEDFDVISQDLGEEPESQCGTTNDTQHVELYDGTLGVTQAFVGERQPRVGNHMAGGTIENCSGTLIARDIFVSAGHCSYAVGDEVHFNHQLDQFGNPRATVQHDVVEIIDDRFDANFDYAVVRLSGTPANTFGYTRLADDEARVIAPFPGQLLTIIGHPDLGVAAGTDYKRVATGPFLSGASGIGANWFMYQADTYGENSGSGVIRLDGQMVGVHTNAGCAQVDPPTGGNSGMRMPVLLDNVPILQQVASMQGVSFANVNGTGGVDAVVINFNRVSARVSNGSGFVSQANWTTDPYFGGRGTFFADVTGDGLADAIAANNGNTIVRRSNGTSFSANETWTSIGYFGDRSTFYADVTGDGRADGVVVNNSAVVVRRSNGSSLNANETWLSSNFSGTLSTHLADVTGDGLADLVAINDNLVSVRRSTGSAFGAIENWTSNRFFGAFGTFVADVTGDGRADLVGANNGVTTVRRSTGTAFGANENWLLTTHAGSLGTHFADATGDGRADSIAVTPNGVTVRPSTGSAFSASQTWVNTAYFGAR
jgi:hypothetical protein